MSDYIPKILLVDDEQNMLKSLSEIFAVKGYAISTAASGDEAIAHLEKSNFDLCVLDLLMPGVTGHDVMDYIRGRLMDTEVVVVSGDTNIDAAISALKHRAFAFIKKPFDSHELLKTVASGLKRQAFLKEVKSFNLKIKKSERLHRYLANYSPDCIYVLDQNGKFLYVNKRIETLLGYRSKELIGKHYSFIVWEEDLDRAQYAFDERRTGERATRNFGIRLKGTISNRLSNLANFQTVPIELNAKGIYSYHEIGTKCQQGTIGIVREVDERDQDNTASAHAHYDVLTGLPNRFLLDDRLNIALNQAKRYGHLLVVMFIDLDGFKNINDTHGHKAGDELLQNCSQRLRDVLRKGDTIARFGGDEFILVLPQIDNPKQAEAIAKKILLSLSKPLTFKENIFSITASIGISIFPHDGDSQAVLIEHADMAMYRVKKRHKNGFLFYSNIKESLGGTADGTGQELTEARMEQELLEAMELNQFVVFYQPMLDFNNMRKIIGLEALLRWQHPDKGLIFPDEFFPIARKKGLMPSIDEWVLKSVCRDFRDSIGAGYSPVQFSVNVSYEMMMRKNFINSLKAILSQYQFPSDKFQIEIGEDWFSQPTDELVNKLAQMHSLGVRVVIDSEDGTLFDKWHELAFDGIKINCSLLDKIASTNNGATISKFVAMANRSDFNITAKNLESQRSLAQVDSINFDTVQGFLYYHPLPPQAAKLLLRNVE